MDADDRAEIEQILGYHFFEKQHLIRALPHPAYANEQLQQKTLLMDQMAYSTLGDAVLKTGLILFLMEKGIQTKGGITQEKEQLEDNITLAKVACRLRIKKTSGWAAGRKACDRMAKIRCGYARSPDRGDLSRQRCRIRGCQTVYRRQV